MRKGIIIALVISFTIISMAAYTFGWIYLNSIVINYINQYVEKPLNITGTDRNVSFSKVTMYGFPFKFGIKIHGFKEETNTTIIDHVEPLEIYYHRKFLYVEHKGRSVVKFKPLESGFGRDVSGNFTYRIEYPIGKKIIFVLFQKKVEELINFFKGISFSAKDVVIKDLVGNRVLTEIPYSNINIKIENKPYYTSIKEVFENIPKKYIFDSHIQITKADNAFIAAPYSIIYGAFVPSVFEQHSKGYIQTKANHILNIFDEAEIDISEFKYTSDVINYNGRISLKIVEPFVYYISHSADFTTEPIFVSNFIKILEYLLDRSPDSRNKIRSQLWLKNIDRTKFSKLNVKVIVDGTTKYLKNEQLSFNMQELMLRCNDMGMGFNGVLNLISNDVNSNGSIIIYNFNNIIDSIVQLTENDELNSKLKLKVFKTFFKQVSRYPESKSSDLVFEYRINSINDVIINDVKGIDVIKRYINTAMQGIYDMFRDDQVRQAIAIHLLIPDYMKEYEIQTKK